MPNAHIKSGWKAPIGKVLTNARIARYQREGRYGRHAQLMAILKYRVSIPPGTEVRCKCGSKEVVAYRKDRFWCTRCQAVARAERAKVERDEQKFRDRIEATYQ